MITKGDWGLLLGFAGLGTAIYLATRKSSGTQTQLGPGITLIEPPIPDDVSLIDPPTIVPRGAAPSSYDVLRAQGLLRSLGYYYGPQDGVENAQFLGQLDQFQFDHMVPQTGQLDAGTLQAMEYAAAQPGATYQVSPLAGLGGRVTRKRRRYAERF